MLIRLLHGAPHSDGFFPGASKMIRGRIGPVSPEAKRQVLAGGTMGIYGLQAWLEAMYPYLGFMYPTLMFGGP
jgi:hypothetical protein